MDEKVIKNEPSLPPGYVSLAQLQERWLQKQQEKKLKEKQQEAEEKKQSEQNEIKNQKGVKTTTNGQGKMEGGSISDVTHRKMNGREMGAIEEKGKGKEMVIGGFENGERKKKKNQRFKNRKSTVDGEKGNGAEITSRNEVKMRIPGDLSGENSGKGRNSGEIKGIEESGSVSVVEVLPKNVKKTGYRGEFRRKGDNRGSGYKVKKEYIVKQHHTEVMEDGKGDDDKKLMEKGVNGVKESNEVELKLEGKTLELASEIDGVKGRDRNGLLWQMKNNRNMIKENKVDDEEGLKTNSLLPEKKVDNVNVVVKSGKNGEKSEGGNGLRRYRNWKRNNGRKFEGSTLNGWKGDSVGDSSRYRSYGRYENRRKMEQRDSSRMVWVKKEEK